MDPDGGSEPASCEDDPCPEGERCLEEGGETRCLCPAGSERGSDGVCTVIDECEPLTCDGRGTCSESADGIHCECDEGYAGPRCGECASGYARNHLGDCVTDLCDPSPCGEPERPRCEVVDGVATCACAAGTHDEAGECVPDTVCSPTTCSGRGTCVELEDDVACECDEGTAGRFCDSCDEEAGYHDDGAGGCTDDVCVPNPCTGTLETVCVEAADGTARCECDPGAHREDGVCVGDEVCESDTCAPTGTCSVVDGRATCACDAGWAGERCDTCAAGYHDDGAGGCTDDVCVPSPCTVPDRSVCTDDGGTAVCGCDAGYHDDGVGGCTTDPCVPDPCAASGQACRDAGGVAECYTPTCDDGEPCTDDAFVSGSCVHTPVADGTGCSTTLCTTGQTCSSGVCGGGTAVVCDDGNPCTASTCDALTGCAHTPDDSLVPDDGVGCTVDTCAAGVASNVPTDAECSDGAFCNGAESCAPTDPGADAEGCVDGAAPIPPASTPCRSYGACDEATDGFPLTALGAGESCDDTLSCTTGDTCDAAGICRGTPLSTCPATCDTTVPWSTVTSSGPSLPGVNIDVARLTGSVTVGGAALLDDGTAHGGFQLYLLNVETEQRHRIADPHYSYVSSTVGYELRDPNVDATIPPGVYDLVYERGYWNGSSSNLPWVSRTDSTDVYPNGYVLLQRRLVVGAGAQTLHVDVPVARLGGSITVGGAALLDDGTAHGGFQLYLHDRETGQRHRIADPHYSYVSSTVGYELREPNVDATIPPGTYDLIYERGYWNGSSSNLPWVSRTDSTDVYPNGYVILQQGVTVPAGSSTLDVDVPVARLTGNITVGGAALRDDGTAHGGFQLYLHDRETGQRHRIADPHYSYVSSTVGYELRDADVDATIPPGTYDLIYERGYWNGSSSNLPWVSRTDSTDVYPNGYVILQQGVTVPAGSSTLDVDVPVARLTGNITVGGAALRDDGTAHGGFQLYLYDRETGQRHRIADPHYSYVSSTVGYELREAGVDATIPPGTYDLIYERGYWNGSDSNLPWVSRTDRTDVYANGYVVLRHDVTVPTGASTLDVDVPVARLTGNITVGGAALLDDGTAHGGFQLYLHDRETRMRHRIADPHYSYVSSTVGYELREPDVDATIPPGTYDLIYERGYWNGSDSNLPWVSRTDTTDVYPNGYVVLRHDVTVPSGASTLHVDVPLARLSSPITVEGRPLLDDGTAHGGFQLYLYDRETRQRHRVADPHYSYVSSTVGYELREPNVDATIPPGTYDLIYERGYWNGSDSNLPWVSRTDTADVYPNGYTRVRSCVLVP